MSKYISPQLDFSKVEIFEKIADKCWGMGGAAFSGYDKSGNPVSFHVSWSYNGCNGGLPPELLAAFQQYNVSDSYYRNNIANTKAIGFNIDQRS